MCLKIYVLENIYKTGNICRFWAAARIAATIKKKMA